VRNTNHVQRLMIWHQHLNSKFNIQNSTFEPGSAACSIDKNYAIGMITAVKPNVILQHIDNNMIRSMWRNRASSRYGICNLD